MSVSISVVRPPDYIVTNINQTANEPSRYGLHLRNTRSVLFSLLLVMLVSLLGLGKSAEAQATIFNPSLTPNVIDSSDGNAVELGLKFRADSNGSITGLRFYKASTNVGTHVGHIWSSSGALLGSATFINETGSGWQQVNFSTPIAVSANTTYIASYFAPSGHYSATDSYFATTGIDNPPLHALATGVDGANGVYLYSSAGGFPADSYQGSNYWVDVVYSSSVPAPTPTGTSSYTILKPSSTPSVIDSNDGSPVELGVKFRADSGGFLTGLRFYKASTNVGTHVGHIWSSSGALLGSATFTNETGSGWQQVSLSTPIAVSANTTYIASYFAPSGHYSATNNMFSIAGIDSPPLHALGTGVDGANGVYLYSSAGGFPTNSYQATNYWVDVAYNTTGSTTTPATNPQVGVSAASMSFGSVAVKTATTQALTLTSMGTSPLSINSVSITGAGFTVVGDDFPVSLSPNQALTLQVQFLPTATGAATGQITISSNSLTGSTSVVALSGTGSSSNAQQLSVSPASLNFDNVSLNSASTQTVTLTATGTAPVTVNSATVLGAGFMTVGGSYPFALNPGQTMTQQVQFRPTVAGTAAGQVIISSNSSAGSTASVALSGTGMAVAHEVDLSWSAPGSSSDPVAGYNIYRLAASGSYQLMNPAVNAQTAYIDGTVLSGTTYEYVVKSVDSSGTESSPSNQITVTIP